ncbi:uncharacterized protein TNCV_69871 [Trichonephila clavipes]|nr:uncharacterized protein TNCV_69871 [Trichonephila clavipes]
MNELNLDQAPQDISKEEFQLDRVRLQAFVAATDPLGNGFRWNVFSFPTSEGEFFSKGCLHSHACRDHYTHKQLGVSENFPARKQDNKKATTFALYLCASSGPMRIFFEKEKDATMVQHDVTGNGFRWNVFSFPTSEGEFFSKGCLHSHACRDHYTHKQLGVSENFPARKQDNKKATTFALYLCASSGPMRKQENGLIRDRIVLNIKDSGLQERLLGENNFNVEKATEIVRQLKRAGTNPKYEVRYSHNKLREGESEQA